METKTKILLVTGIALTSFAAGRYMTPTKVETKTVEVTKIVHDTTEVKKTRKKVTTIEDKKPTGEVITRTTETEVADDRKDDRERVSNTKDNEKTTTFSGSRITLSALAGFQLGTSPIPVYGGAITKPILGPITLGAFYLTNKTVGLSLGLTF